ncbi:cache domain-containing protein [uncultured Desulfosarcina sp.]|uniref:cache domain-containing protein n=1 Tax=uncultured Desulfosarcina sp. TaxID=218289 RepID=UPI0029C6835E|nr:cache domain-containing protein [uncultured Desulfosarcina sp.]
MKRTIAGVLAVVVVMLLTVPVQAGTRDDCISKCKEAGDFIKTQGIDSAIKEINNKKGRFVWNDGVSYVFLMNMKAKMLAHPHKPELTKPDTLIEATDVDGKAFFKDFVKAAEKGKGWTKYMWPVPGMEINKPKHTFIYRVPGTDYFVGAGFYVMSPGVFY